MMSHGTKLSKGRHGKYLAADHQTTECEITATELETQREREREREDQVHRNLWRWRKYL
jgi:hypothetical protein